MTVSIIIAVKGYCENLKECVSKCLELDYPEFEIIILPDKSFANITKGTVPDIKIIPTGKVQPAKKRDIALNFARGEIFAFIDDDAYPAKDWLKQAVKNFSESAIAAVGGPAVTPSGDGLRQKASGCVYSSPLVSGGFINRYLPKKKRYVDDYPSCNFLVRRSIFEQLGGFNTEFWPGEDTKLCLEITKDLGKKIIYDPSVLVFHHRRPLFIPHLKQIASYALHRGYFVKRYPETSFRFFYFIPTLFLLTLVGGGVLYLFLMPFRIIYFLGLILYLFLVFTSSISKDLRLIPLVFPGIILTHTTYGVWFLRGLLALKLREEYNG